MVPSIGDQSYHTSFFEGSLLLTLMSSTFENVPCRASFSVPSTKASFVVSFSSLKRYCLVQVLLKVNSFVVLELSQFIYQICNVTIGC
ncbi:hypothetical protein Bca4012_037979 [Brassica carinata]